MTSNKKSKRPLYDNNKQDDNERERPLKRENTKTKRDFIVYKKQKSNNKKSTKEIYQDNQVSNQKKHIPDSIDIIQEQRNNDQVFTLQAQIDDIKKLLMMTLENDKNIREHSITPQYNYEQTSSSKNTDKGLSKTQHVKGSVILLDFDSEQSDNRKNQKRVNNIVTIKRPKTTPSRQLKIQPIKEKDMNKKLRDALRNEIVGIVKRLLVEYQLDINKTYENQKDIVNNHIISVIQKTINKKTFPVVDGVIKHIIHEQHHHKREYVLNQQRGTDWNDNERKRKHANSRHFEISKKSAVLY
ncbi:4168_t:CDS:2 [Funneliformis caledonium]|uniref:4168_t:CDS:1 n=1 Tax=Funneliformis caledonium TaxID=1117310 RepID=A0A9N8VH40_9GLOM|nr:4168_t:CDS:2 [Funneliformis caledonium]